MSIRFRLVLSYLAMILIPIIFVVVSALIIALLFRGDLKELKSIYLPPEHHTHVSEREQLFADLQRETLKNPGNFANQTYLKKIDQQLSHVSDTSILVRKDDKIIFHSWKLKKVDKKELPSFGLLNEADPVEEIGHQIVSIKKLDFYFPDNAQGSLFLITDASSLAKFVHFSYPFLFASLIIILVVTNGILTFFVSRSIIRPIRDLQRAAKEIKDGDLSSPIKPMAKDELGELAQSFEEMRVRLKSSIETQLAYEENRKELIANISHDLKTPITTIKGYVEGIRDGVANSPEKMERYIQTIHAKSVDLDHMIDELFLYSKLDLQRLPFQFERFSFSDYLGDFIEELRFELENKLVKIDYLVTPDGGYLINGDREHLKRVITNIVENSLKYNDKKHRSMKFELSDAGSHIHFKMKDNGPGIDPESLPHIFDRFYRVDQARGTEKSGSGLGLSIAKRIIEEHHGTIWAESEIGQGTTIHFTLEKAGEENEKHSCY